MHNSFPSFHVVLQAGQDEKRLHLRTGRIGRPVNGGACGLRLIKPPFPRWLAAGAPKREGKGGGRTVRHDFNPGAQKRIRDPSPWCIVSHAAATCSVGTPPKGPSPDQTKHSFAGCTTQVGSASSKQEKHKFLTGWPWHAAFGKRSQRCDACMFTGPPFLAAPRDGRQRHRPGQPSPKRRLMDTRGPDPRGALIVDACIVRVWVGGLEVGEGGGGAPLESNPTRQTITFLAHYGINVWNTVHP